MLLTLLSITYVCIILHCLFQDNCPRVHNPNQNLEACNGTQGNGLGNNILHTV